MAGSSPAMTKRMRWIASQSLSSGAHSRDPLARNDGVGDLSPISHKTHSHPRDVAHDLAGETFGAGPRFEAAVALGGVDTGAVTGRAPAVLVFCAGEFTAAAQLRPAGKSARIVHRPVIADRSQNAAAADLNAEEIG